MNQNASELDICFYCHGLLAFHTIPFIKSIAYAFSRVTLGENGLTLSPVGLDNFKYMLFTDANFLKNIVSSISSLFYNTPIILIFSLFVALILNQKFRGRLFARAVFFLPVIVASGLVIKIMQEDIFTQFGMTSDSTSLFRTDAITNFLYQFGLNQKIVSAFTQITSQIFDLSWRSGLQILLFLSALQTIPKSYYEAASIEGANDWEAFWKITFPVLSPAMLLVTIYTIIESFTDFQNPVMSDILSKFDDIKYGYATASALIYFVIISVILLIIAKIFSKRVFYNS